MNTSRPPKPAAQSLIPPKVPPQSLQSMQNSGNVETPLEFADCVSKTNIAPMKHDLQPAPLLHPSQTQHLSLPAQPNTSSKIQQPTVTSSQNMPLQIQDIVCNTNPSYGACALSEFEADEVQPKDREPMYDCLDYPMPFDKLVEENAVDLPFQVDACESIYEGDSLFQDGRLNVYFMKHTDAVKVSFNSGVSNWLPLSSAYQCNVFTCKDINEQYAGKHFSSMESALKASTLPLVVYVTADCKKSLSIKAGELLIVKSIELSKKNTVKSLSCWSISTNEKKHLHGSCMAYFSINPEQTKVYIHDIIEHYKLPIYAIFYFHSSVKRVMVEERLVVKSAIATVAPQSSSDEILEIILMDMVAMTKKCEIPNSYYAELVKRSCSIYDKFTPASVDKVISDMAGSLNPFQTELFKHVLPGWRNGTKLYCPTHTLKASASANLVEPVPPPSPLPSISLTPVSTPGPAFVTSMNHEEDMSSTSGFYEELEQPFRGSSMVLEQSPYLLENRKILTAYNTEKVCYYYLYLPWYTTLGISWLI